MREALPGERGEHPRTRLKYGNLVTMIQGLGQKHKSMLPETPNPEEVAAVDSEQKSNRRVKKWATDVSEYHTGAGNMHAVSEPNAYPATSDYKAEAEEDAERLTHFDRQLKEIRVGESPSRPWGVHIPSTYLEKQDGGASSGSSSPVAAVPVVDARPTLVHRDPTADTLPSARDDHVLAAIEANRELNTLIAPIHAPDEEQRSPPEGHVAGKAKGKCPFDRRTMQASKPDDPTTRRVFLQPDTAHDANRPYAPISNHNAELNVSTPSTQPLERPNGSGASASGRLVNYGLAIVARPECLPRAGFENRGTLVLGYQEAGAREIAAGLGAGLL